MYTSRGIVGRDGQRVTKVYGKSAKPKSHTHPPHIAPPPLFICPSIQSPRSPSLFSTAAIVSRMLRPSVPAVVLDHVGQLNDELALFILLTALKGMFLEGVAEGRRERETAVNSNDRWMQDINRFISLTE